MSNAKNCKSYCKDCCNNCSKHICNHSTAYGVLLTSYAISLYELWNGEKTIKENIINSILLSIQFFLGILDIKGIQIFNMCRDR